MADLRTRLRTLTDAAAQVPAWHRVASFLGALVVGIVLVGAVSGSDAPSSTSASGSGDPVRSRAALSDERDTEDTKDTAGRLTAAQSAGQLVMQPVRLDRPKDFEQAKSLIGAGTAGGALLYLADDNGAAPKTDVIAGQVDGFRRAAARKQLPPPLIVLAVEGIRGTDYCADPVDGIRDQLARARTAGAGAGESLALAKLVRQVDADAVLATSLKDETEGCRNGNEVDPGAHVDGLKKGSVLLFARGAQGWAPTAPAGKRAQEQRDRYEEAADHGLQLLAAARTPADEPAWRTPDRVDRIRRMGAPLIGTPDLAFGDRDDGAEPSLNGRVKQALKAGVDLALYSHGNDADPTKAGDAVRTWYQQHPARLERSCKRMLRLKRKALGSDVAPGACSAR